MMPNAISVLDQAFKARGQSEQLIKVLNPNVRMRAYVDRGVLNILMGHTPEKVVALFKEIVAPPDAVVLNDVRTVIDKLNNQEWAIEVHLTHIVSGERTNYTITVICTLANNLISNLEFKIDPSAIFYAF